ncbi:hypothetical protein DSECCO2_342470 [anaerobic digester metagenome]
MRGVFCSGPGSASRCPNPPPQGDQPARGGDRPLLRITPSAPARLGSIRCCGIYARHHGDCAERGAQSGYGRRSGLQDGEPAVCLGFVPPVSLPVRRGGQGARTPAVPRDPPRGDGARWGSRRKRAWHIGGPRGGEPVRTALWGDGDVLSSRHHGPAPRLYRGGHLLMGESPGWSVQESRAGRRGHRDGGRGPGDGLRQPRGCIGRWCRFHTQPLERSPRTHPGLPLRSTGGGGGLG